MLEVSAGEDMKLYGDGGAVAVDDADAGSEAARSCTDPFGVMDALPAPLIDPELRSGLDARPLDEKEPTPFDDGGADGDAGVGVRSTAAGVGEAGTSAACSKRLAEPLEVRPINKPDPVVEAPPAFERKEERFEPEPPPMLSSEPIAANEDASSAENEPRDEDDADPAPVNDVVALLIGVAVAGL